ncbi:hypothetical protein [Desulfospira joergensenii]|uniref:hypothetical protein n=1 Tax=Desulfospira joergensenii TaxID=53329 RepID=UPI0003B4546D|nr:hypothetical protein [Desulfospira joergensenii]
MVLFLVLAWASQGFAFELHSRYAVITYDDPADLRRFNDELYMGGELRSLVKRQGSETVEQEVAAKFNVIVEKAMAVLDMYPAPLKFSIVILPHTRAVKKAFKEIYNVEVDYIAFYSPHLNRVFYSANNGRLRVTCHEIGHVVVENYFKISPPQKIHEVMAQYVEKHIND